MIDELARPVERLGAAALEALPLLGAAAVFIVLGLVAAGLVARAAERAMRRTSADPSAVGLLTRVSRTAVIVAVVIYALEILGVRVGPLLAGLGIAGLAVGLALQGILENFVCGIILLLRRPFRAGDQIMTNDYEGTVQQIDTRVTRLRDYDGRLVLIPNAEVYKQPLVNLTRLGSRRTSVFVGVDYRDDADRARAVIGDAVGRVEGVASDPAPEVLLTELAESSVLFEVRYWTAPDIATVRQVQDRVLAAAKRGVQDAGMTIPWPIRTLAMDGPVRLARE
ncbi:MAG: mechanosensitive ion channel family protein [Actinomycetota bacterium]|nr:mechanosensitive ion channel family protein [Actinomycetota bacterium]